MAKFEKYGHKATVVRLKKSGRKRLVMVHETPDLSDAPRFLINVFDTMRGVHKVGYSYAY